MWMAVWLGTMATALLAAQDAQGSKERIDVAVALRSMVTEACERNFADGPEDGVPQCLEKHLDPATESNERLWLDGNEGDQICLLNGGVLAERMPACVEAMAAWMAAERTEDLAATFGALGGLFESCIADRLCAAGE